ncbi:SGNH/GDSL hydrolase family protein [Methylocystis sp.]|uniref:SGNH/GDSL hydrolase family protein n=1 Tax=Methylocystis sp. TaxID=1911079 RepID=UPI003DA3D12F
MTAVDSGNERIAAPPKHLRPVWLALLPLGLGFILALAGLEYARTHVLVKLEEAALGTQTQMVYESGHGERILCQDARENRLCEAAYEKAGYPPVVLWLGNSQLPAVNRYKPDDATAPTLLHDALARRGSYVIALAQPNANLAEHGLIFAAVAPRYAPRVLLLPVVLDDIREQGIRTHVASFIEDSAARVAAQKSLIWPVVAPMLAVGSAARDVPPVERTMQQRIEVSLNDRLSEWWPLWRERAKLRGILALTLHTVRNKVLGINAQSKRNVDPAVYAEKMRILAAILEHARNLGVRVLLYVPPYRLDISGPYLASDTDRLKADLVRLAAEHGAHYADFEDTVPGPEWGTVVDPLFGFEDYDFMHFTGEGHRRFASSLDAELKRMGI